MKKKCIELGFEWSHLNEVPNLIQENNNMFVFEKPHKTLKRANRGAQVVTAGRWQFQELADGQEVIKASEIDTLDRASRPRRTLAKYSKQEIHIRIFAERLFNSLALARKKEPGRS